MPNRSILTFIIWAAFAPSGIDAQSDASTADTIREIIYANREMNAAAIRGDVGALERYWATDVTFVGNDGRIWNKAERLEDFRSRNRSYANERAEEPQVRLLGDVAILSYASELEGTRDGRPFQSRSFLTRVFNKRAGRWELVYQQSALLEPRR